jgi:hypothetical protein
METETSQHSPAPSATTPNWPVYPPLELEARAFVDTATAAHHLNRRPQTLRGWACHEDGPLRPARINGRLAWRVSDIKRVLGVAP